MLQSGLRNRAMNLQMKTKSKQTQTQNDDDLNYVIDTSTGNRVSTLNVGNPPDYITDPNVVTLDEFGVVNETPNPYPNGPPRESPAEASDAPNDAPSDQIEIGTGFHALENGGVNDLNAQCASGIAGCANSIDGNAGQWERYYDCLDVALANGFCTF